MAEDGFTYLLSSLCIPQLNRVIFKAPTTGQHLPVWAEGHAKNFTTMAAEGFTDLLSGLWVPQTDYLVFPDG